MRPVTFIHAVLFGSVVLAAPLPSSLGQRDLFGGVIGSGFPGSSKGKSSSGGSSGNAFGLPNVNVDPTISPNVSPTVNGPSKLCVGISVCDPITAGGDGSTNTNND